jgi:hypothetical protein
VPIFTWQFRHHGASWATLGLALAGVMGQFWATLQGSLYTVAPNLHQRLRQTQRIAIEQNGARLAALAGALVVMPSTITAIFIAFLAQTWAAFRLRHVSREIANDRQPEDPAARQAILAFARRVLPSALYFSISSQVSIWLMSLWGNTTGLAEIGALGRIGQVFTILTGIAGAVLAPRFARLGPDPALVIRRFFQTITFLAGASSLVVLLVALFPREVLQVLGANYANLTGEVVLAVTAAACHFLAANALGLSNARGIVVSPWLGISFNFVVQAVLISVLEVRTVHGVLWLGLLVAAFELVLFMAYFVFASRRARHPAGQS